MAVTRRTRVAPKEAEKPVEETTTVRRRRPVTEVAPVEETITVRRRAPAKPSAELEQAIKIIETIGDEASEKRNVTDHQRIVQEYTAKANTPKKAIRAKCIECMGGMIAEVGRCTSTSCALFSFRMGENPFHALSKHNKDKD